MADPAGWEKALIITCRRKVSWLGHKPRALLKICIMEKHVLTDVFVKRGEREDQLKKEILQNSLSGEEINDRGNGRKQIMYF